MFEYSEELQGVIIFEDVISAIIDALTAEIESAISDLGAESFDGYTTGYSHHYASKEAECIEVETPYGVFEVSYGADYEWSSDCGYDHYTDPCGDCFWSEITDECAELTGLQIYSPDGDEVAESIIDRIADQVNERLN